MFVDVREVGPRDGLQLERILAWPAKVRLFEALVETGVRRIEATAFVSPAKVPSMADADRVGELVRRWPEVEFSALALNLRGVQRALAAGFRRVEYVVSAGDQHSRANAGAGTAEAVRAIGPAAELVHERGGQLEVVVATAWDCPFGGRTPVDRTVEVVRSAIELGADELCLADTVGTATPGRVLDLLKAVRPVAGHLELAAHFHNTRGTGLASAWAAVAAGVSRLDASVGGLGGCPFAPGATGNIATEELVYLLHDSDISTGINIDRVLEAARLVTVLVGHTGDSNLLRAGGPLRPWVAMCDNA